MTSCIQFVFMYIPHKLLLTISPNGTNFRDIYIITMFSSEYRDYIVGHIIEPKMDNQ